MRPRSKLGLAAVAAAISLLTMSVLAFYLAAYLFMQNRAAAWARQEAQLGQAPKVPELITGYVYNFSLCNLLVGKIVPLPWTLVVHNAGNIPAEVDNVVVNVGGDIVFQRSGRWLINPGEYLMADLSTIPGAPALHNAIVQIHTSRGGFFLGGYATPDPNSLVYIGDDGVCVEP